MIDEDLKALRTMLRRMEPSVQIDIGSFRCSAHELLLVVDEAVQVRELFKQTEVAENKIGP